MTEVLGQPAGVDVAEPSITGVSWAAILAGAAASLALTLVLLSFGAYATFVSAPATRANAKIQLNREIAAENLAFCEKFGIRADTSDFGVCSQQLAIVRQKQADRDSAAAAE